MYSCESKVWTSWQLPPGETSSTKNSLGGGREGWIWIPRQHLRWTKATPQLRDRVGVKGWSFNTIFHNSRFHLSSILMPIRHPLGIFTVDRPYLQVEIGTLLGVFMEDGNPIFWAFPCSVEIKTTSLGVQAKNPSACLCLGLPLLPSTAVSRPL